MIVRDKSCSVVCAFDPDEEKSMQVIKKVMLDWHQDISCFINILSNCDQSQPALDITKDYSWNQVQTMNNAAYVVNSQFKCVDRVTHKLGFHRKVIEPLFTLPDQMMHLNEQGAPFPVVFSYNPSLFDPDNYIKIILN